MRKLVFILRRALFREAERLCFRSFCRTTVSKEGKRAFLKHEASEEDLKDFLEIFCKEESLELGTRIISVGKIKQKKFYLTAYQPEEGKIEVDIFLGPNAKLESAYEWMEREAIKSNGAEEKYYKRLKSDESTYTVEEALKDSVSGRSIEDTGVWKLHEETLKREKERFEKEQEISERRRSFLEEEREKERLEKQEEEERFEAYTRELETRGGEELPPLEIPMPKVYEEEESVNEPEEEMKSSEEEPLLEEASEQEEVKLSEEPIQEKVESEELVEEELETPPQEEISFAEETSEEVLEEKLDVKKEEEAVSKEEDEKTEESLGSFDDMFGGEETPKSEEKSEELSSREVKEEASQTEDSSEGDFFHDNNFIEEDVLENPPEEEEKVAAPVKQTRVAAAPSSPKKSSLKINYSNNLDGVSVAGGSHSIDAVLSQMVAKGASDLHLTIGQPIVFRIDGEIRREESSKLTAGTMESYVDSIIPGSKKAEFIETSDIDFAHEVKGKGRFRVNLYRDANGVACVIRHIPDKIISAQELNLPPALIKFCGASKGLVLVTGPTGSGKSTSLAALLDHINETRAEHILTIEDPIEFVYEQKKCLVNQREVSKHTDSFHAALRASLREDPDIILVGELRDLETTSHAVELAETGHLVFATLHTNTAIATIDRIIDMYPPEQQNSIRNVLAANVRGIASQVLCKKIGGGRAAALEVLVMDEAVSSLIRENKIHMVENHLKTHREAGNALMADALLDLVEKKIITYEEAWAKATNKKSFESQAERRNSKKA